MQTAPADLLVKSNVVKAKFHFLFGHADIFLDRYAYTPSII